MISDEARRAAAQSRKEQGLPPTVRDAAALSRVAQIMRLSDAQRTAVVKRKRRRKRAA